MSAVKNISLISIEGKPMSTADFSGRVLLLVNVASQCGLTPQYTGLQSLFDEYGEQGLTVLGLPCNQFGAQEPGTEQEIRTFCETKYSTTFPMTTKIEVNGPGRHPLYEALIGDDGPFPGDIKWNFEKILIGRDGTPLQRFAPTVAPDDAELVSAIKEALG